MVREDVRLALACILEWRNLLVGGISFFHLWEGAERLDGLVLLV